MLNQIPKEKGEDSPWIKMHDKALPAEYIKPLGSSLTYKLNQTEIHSKLDEKGAPGILIGFHPHLLSYKIINSSGKIVDSKHVIFNNQEPIKIHPIEPEEDKSPQLLIPPPQEVENFQHPLKDEENDSNDKPSASDSEESSDDEVSIENNLRSTLRDRSKLSKPDRYGFLSEKLPKSLKEAMQKPVWKESALKEFKSIEDQDVWEEVEDNKVINPLS